MLSLDQIGGQTHEEYRTHFALWSVLASPLLIGLDVRRLADVVRSRCSSRDHHLAHRDIENLKL
jgi:alpha-galactosidase